MTAKRETMPETAPTHGEVTQADVLRRMTPGQRLTIAANLTWQAREWMAAALRAQKPELPEAEIQCLVRDRILYGTTD